ncbi:MAG: cytochrome P450 [Polyangiaceae bacterium]|jgi:cytochrome P450|nr:cytochrome P450 [Polyangiaceae bacterium]
MEQREESEVVREGLPPGPGWPRLALTGWYVKDPWGCIRSARGRYGDLFTLRVMNGDVVVGCTPAHARQVFSADPGNFRAFAVDALGPVLGEGALLVSSGETHRRQRKLLQPPFHGSRMRAYGRAMREVALEHGRALRAGKDARVHRTTTAISLDVILRTVFGVEAGAMAEGRQLLIDVLEGFSPMVVFSRKFQHPLFPPWRRLERALGVLDARIEEEVRQRRGRGEHGEDILGMLLDARWEGGEPMTAKEIRDQLLTLLVAGHETTAIALAWAIHEVYRRPWVLKRLREEIEGLGGDPEPEALARLPYLSAVCDETLRLRAVVPDVVRQLTQPFEYGGWRLPAGACVSVEIEAIHRDPGLYPEPDAFQPERFLERKPGPFEFLPFGGGHRRCLGAAFSDFEARVVLGTLVTRLDLRPLLEEVPARRNVTMGPRHGVPVEVLAVR